MRTIGRAVAIVAMAAAAAMVSGVAVAGKPSGGGGGSTGGGKIWYSSGGQYFTMNSDGSGKAAAAGAPLSRTHGGHAWSVRWNRVSGQYPDGTGRYEAFAVRDDGVSVQLTDQPDLKRVAVSVQVGGFGNNPWTPDGQRIAFVAQRYLPSGNYTSAEGFEGGLYVADLAFDGAGDITGLASQPAAPAFPRPMVLSPGSIDTYVPDIIRFSWAPDGVQFVYDDAQAQGGIRVGSLAGTDRALVSGYYAQWSPDGSKIAYVNNGGRGSYRTVRPDGTGDTLVYKQSQISSGAGPLRWSPTGSHIAFTRIDNFLVAHSVWRVQASGGGATNLTSDVSSAQLVEWAP